MRILIVDDEMVSRRKIEKILENFGVCSTAENGAEAILAFSQGWMDWQPYDLICLDVAMPGTDGTEVLFEIRRMEREHGVAQKHQAKILMVTSHGDRDTIVTCVQAGCDGYITKPFNLTTIRDKLEEIELV